MNFAQIASRAYNCPVLLEPGYGALFYSVLNSRVFSGANDVTVLNHTGTEPAVSSSMYADTPKGFQPYSVVDGAAIIKVDGTLIHRNNTVNPQSGITGYDGLEINIKAANQDTAIDRVVFDINSSGGEAVGCFELAQMITDMEKPTLAIVNMKAFSGAYAIASACDHIVVPKRGGVGSVGVFNCHADHSKEIEDKGVKLTMFYRGARKLDGHPMLPLNTDAEKKIDAVVQTVYDDFTNFVAVNRGMSQQAVKDTEAGTFFGPDAVKVGLADAVMSKDDAFNAFLSGHDFKDDFVSETQSGNGDFMTGKTPKASAVIDKSDMISNDVHTAAIAQATAAGREDGIAVERKRWTDIVNAPEASGRESTALSFAQNGLAVDAATSALKTVPLVTAPSNAISQMEDAGGADAGDGSDIVVEDAADAVKTSNVMPV